MDDENAVPSPGSGRIPSGSPCAPRFTVRQREVLELLCEGLADKAISRRMQISLGTVKSHVGSILRELGVSSRLQAVVSTCR
jgi:DNA-binding NarL/FixJ family response regulator